MIVANKSLQGEKYTRCHDFSLYEKGNGYDLICVADGVGENTYCQVGSQVACESLRDYVKKRWIESRETSFQETKQVYRMLREGFQYAVAQLKKLAKEQNHDVEEYSTTLSAICILDDCVVWGHSGDGAIFSVTEKGEIKKMTTERSGTVSGEVYPLLSGDLWWSFGIGKREYAFLLMTDGVLEFFSRLHRKEKITPFYKSFFENMKSENREEFIEKLVYSKEFKQCTRDDRTLAIVIDEQKNIPAEYIYFEEELIKRPNIWAQILVKQIQEQESEKEMDQIGSKEGEVETNSVVEEEKTNLNAEETKGKEDTNCNSKKQTEQLDGRNLDEINNNSFVNELYGFTLDEEEANSNEELYPISLFEITGQQWANYINPICKLAMVDTEQTTLTRIYKNQNKVIFVTIMELSRLESLSDVDQGWNNAVSFAGKLLDTNKYLLKFISENTFDLAEEEDKEYYKNICVNQFDYQNGVNVALAVTRNFDVFRIEFDMDFLESEDISDIDQIGLFVDVYFYDVVRSLWRSVLDRRAIINRNVPKYEETDFGELILKDELWGHKVLHVERK